MLPNHDIQNCVSTLQNKGVILYPTDTVWGLGCDATNADTVAKIFEIKQRNESKSLIVLVDSEAMLRHYVSKIPDFITSFLKESYQPTTIIYQNPKNLAKNAISSDNTIGIRLVQDDFCKKMIHSFQKPIISTSANISGDKTPAVFNQINPKIIEKCDYVVTFRQDDLQIKQPSRLVKFSPKGQPIFLR
ncbi:L-threonylcarbamoyladenylate synthase [Capnocytophaga sp.]|uniref:L-threonylcarbamoyladenylate synthase n=1 Tax=Capnocytophaga sp. TaxID=44737 RepID=UPI0026DCEB90|nr:L-threonylcarbamoyladenylate synthase [Capnocytophaga sp.]MDO5106188.1 L-threonylcarbamoyladenylate synthase [Capnocytophaga sp.]